MEKQRWRKGRNNDGFWHKEAGTETSRNKIDSHHLKHSSFLKNLENHGSTFFFTKIPESYGVAEMWIQNPVGTPYSWKEALLKGHSKNVSQDAYQGNILKYDGTKSIEHECRKMLVCELHSWEDVPLLQASLIKEGFNSVKAIPLGGLLFLLKGDGRNEIRKAFFEGSDWCSSLFKAKVWIGDVLYNIRLIEDGLAPSQETCRSRNLSGWKEEGTDSVGTDSVGSVDSEWRSDNNLDGTEGSMEKVEDDDVEFLEGHMYQITTKSVEDCEKQSEDLGESDIPVHTFVGDSVDAEEEETCNIFLTKKGCRERTELVDVDVHFLHEGEGNTFSETMLWERERKRKGKALIQKLVIKVGFNVSIGPTWRTILLNIKQSHFHL
ncbi:unnamed protein product [Lupinus luteus]|uniref:DUF4283 domain-containing protein n=1 Tax=Lupinus luteus TaxID=3873 RepID=A0AAV1XGF7_LUPLU